MRRVRTGLAVACLVAVTATGCGDSDDDTTSSATTEANGATPAAADTDDGDPGEATTAADEPVAGDCVNDLALYGSDGADGEIEPGTFWADAGPHPDNTVDYDRTLELALASYEIPVDPQFGRGVPVGVPEVPEGGIVLTAYLSRAADQEPVGEDQQYTSVTDESHLDTDGTINNITAYAGGERLLLGDTTITITSIDDEQVCGTIEGVEETDLQEFPVIEGTFVAERIQALDAAEGQ